MEGIRACRFLVLPFLRLSELRVSGLWDIGYRVEEGNWGLGIGGMMVGSECTYSFFYAECDGVKGVMICLLRQRNNNQTTEEELSDSFFRFFSFLFHMDQKGI